MPLVRKPSPPSGGTGRQGHPATVFLQTCVRLPFLWAAYEGALIATTSITLTTLSGESKLQKLTVTQLHVSICSDVIEMTGSRF